MRGRVIQPFYGNIARVTAGSRLHSAALFLLLADPKMIEIERPCFMSQTHWLIIVCVVAVYLALCLDLALASMAQL